MNDDEEAVVCNKQSQAKSKSRDTANSHMYTGEQVVVVVVP